MQKRTISLINQKGGVGKTTTAVNVAYGLADRKRRVLLVDLDPQANATYHVGVPAHETTVTVRDLLKGAKLADVVRQQRGVDLVPASLALAGAEFELGGLPGREMLLREALAAADYDYILVDCPPSLGLLTVNAMTATREVFVVLQPEFLALQGMAQLVDTIGTIKRRLNRRLEITGVVATMFDARKNLNREVVERVTEHLGDRMFKTLIRENVALAEAPSHGQTIYEYKANSTGAADYRALVAEIVKQEKDA
jgi:chromosome partitioning protein